MGHPRLKKNFGSGSLGTRPSFMISILIRIPNARRSSTNSQPSSRKLIQTSLSSLVRLSLEENLSLAPVA
jgi:hypothetical protein